MTYNLVRYSALALRRAVVFLFLTSAGSGALYVGSSFPPKFAKCSNSFCNYYQIKNQCKSSAYLYLLIGSCTSESPASGALSQMDAVINAMLHF